MTARFRGLVGILGAALVLAGCSPKAPTTASSAPAPLPTVVVTTTSLESRPVRRTVSVVGTFYGFDEVSVSPKVDGVIESVECDVGDPAVPGSLLLRIDPTDYALAVAEARRALETELARLGIAALPTGDFDVEQVSAVNRARVSLENAASRFNNRRELFQKRVLAREEYDLAETEYKLAEATHRDAVTQAQAVLATARFRQAALESAEQRLRDCELRVPEPPGFGAWAAILGPGASPVRYTVARRMVSTGQRIVSMNVTESFRLVIAHALKLRVDVPERYTAVVKLAQPVDVRVEAYPDTLFTGQVTRINPTVDIRNRTFSVEITVPNLDGRLHSGGFAEAQIITGTDPAVSGVPPAAIVTFAGVTKLFIVENGTARAVEVQTGTHDRDWVEVIGPVMPGTPVITSGHTRLVAGSPVRIRE